ncbi:hypothetical protein [Homoserinibacter sp. YIM 151385]|uniref:hypothetical protein n=1 Tax=Homoserinibacter sp. YIM 151385 TaxID=2985506 RepID=UPI0022F0E4B2|nr:hypothetical protein [Homoserinibacter sp. YIM 151385]WBU37050.1 hypothetical protein OF852_08935 [Homoserinibacter sp. YIM 151385]
MTANDDTATAPERAVFDVREFARTARGSHRDALDLSGLETQPLDADAARLVRALRDLERGTLHRMRDLLVTATHKDARVTAFLTTWMYEKFWLADALDAVLEQSSAAEDLPAKDGAARRTRRERAERRGPILRAIASNFDGPQIVAAHVTTGLVDEWITQAAYRRLAGAAHALHGLVDTVIEVKDRHIRFLQEEAERRLRVSERARKLTRRELDRAAWPIGSVGRSDDERSFFERMVFGSDEGRAEAGAIRRLLEHLPGIGPGVAANVEARLVP